VQIAFKELRILCASKLNTRPLTALSWLLAFEYEHKNSSGDWFDLVNLPAKKA
jgi:hypothetical protein